MCVFLLLFDPETAEVWIIFSVQIDTVRPIVTYHTTVRPLETPEEKRMKHFSYTL